MDTNGSQRQGGEGGGWWMGVVVRWIARHPRCLQRELIRDHPTRRVWAAHLKSTKTHLTPDWVTESHPLSDIWTCAASIIAGGGNREVGQCADPADFTTLLQKSKLSANLLKLDANRFLLPSLHFLVIFLWIWFFDQFWMVLNSVETSEETWFTVVG